MTNTVSSLGLTLTLLTALGWTCFDIVRKSMAKHVSPSLLGVWIPLGQAPLLCLWAWSQGPPSLPLACWTPMVASIILNVFGLLFFLQALRRSPMSLTIPLLSFTPVGTTLLDWAFKGQVLAPLQWGGIALVVSGAVALGARTSTWPGLCTYVKDSGVRRMAAAALIWSCTAVLDQTALARGANAWYAPALSLGVGFTLALWLLVARHSASLVRSVRTLVRVPLLASCALILGAAALAVQLEALRHAPVGFIETVKRGIGMSGAVIFGRLFFGEPLSSMKLLAVLLLTAGVGLVVMAI